MNFSWDEPKRRRVLAERNIDFLRLAEDMFDGRSLLTIPTKSEAEDRFISVALVGGKFYTLSGLGEKERFVSLPQGGRGMQKKNSTVYYTGEEIRNMIDRGEDQTNWAKANAMTEEELEASILADPDDIHEELDWTKAIKGLPPRKDHINIRVDHDVLEWFRSNGRGYQTMMNSVLRAFVDSRTASK